LATAKKFKLIDFLFLQVELIEISGIKGVSMIANSILERLVRAKKMIIVEGKLYSYEDFRSDGILDLKPITDLVEEYSKHSLLNSP